MSKRVIPMTVDVQRAMEQQYRAFIEKFGREPQGDDPVFFDPNADEPRPLDPRQVERILRGAS